MGKPLGTLLRGPLENVTTKRMGDRAFFRIWCSLGWQPQLGIAQRYAKVRKGEGLEGIDSQIRGQWSGDRNWASGKGLQTEEKEECTMKSVEALISFQPEAAL